MARRSYKRKTSKATKQCKGGGRKVCKSIPCKSGSVACKRNSRTGLYRRRQCSCK